MVAGYFRMDMVHGAKNTRFIRYYTPMVRVVVQLSAPEAVGCSRGPVR